MTRILALLSSAALLAAAAQAQCPSGLPAGLVSWDSFDSYLSIFTPDDEGLTSPPITLPFVFPMPGAVGTLDQLWVNSNGEVYLTDSTLGLTEPAGAAGYGVTSPAELQGIAGASARIVASGADQQASSAAGATWQVTVNLAVAGQVKITWADMARYANLTDRYSFACTLFATGAVQFDYGTLPAATRYVGVSVGNAEPTSGSQDLSTLPSSPATQGILYQAFTAATWDLNNQSVLIVPDLTPGVENYTVAAVTPFAPGPCATNAAYGTGCYAIAFPDSVYQLFPDSPSAKAALDGNALLLARTALGYDATWVPGGAAAFVAPTGGATTLTFSDADDGDTTITPSAAIPTPYGPVATWSVSVNGILTAAAAANNSFNYLPNGFDFTGFDAPELGFYAWHDFNTGEAGSGPVQTEEVGGTLYITWNGVEAYGTPSPNPSTWQFQVNLTSGDVLIVWQSWDPSLGGEDTLVGCTLQGIGADPGSVILSAAGTVNMRPSIQPMALSAAPTPVINPSTLVTYTATNLPEYIPGSGLYISTLFLSVNPNPAGFDLGVIGAPGCNAYIFTLDLDLGGQLTFAPTASWSITYDNVNFAPGNAIAAQAISLITPNSLPNGQNAFGMTVSNAVLSTTQLQ